LVALAAFFVVAGLNAFVVSSTASSTLAILLLLGVTAEGFCAFSRFAPVGGLKIFGIFIISSTFDSSAFSTSPLTGSIVCIFGITVGSTVLCAIGAVCVASTAEEDAAPRGENGTGLPDGYRIRVLIIPGFSGTGYG
jgi:hypothetical protein